MRPRSRFLLAYGQHQRSCGFCLTGALFLAPERGRGFFLRLGGAAPRLSSAAAPRPTLLRLAARGLSSSLSLLRPWGLRALETPPKAKSHNPRQPFCTPKRLDKRAPRGAVRNCPVGTIPRQERYAFLQFHQTETDQKEREAFFQRNRNAIPHLPLWNPPRVRLVHPSYPNFRAVSDVLRSHGNESIYCR